MNSDVHTEAPVSPPQTIDGVNIHLSYMRRDLESINKKLDSIGTAFVTHDEFIAYKETIKEEFKEKATKEELDPIKKLVYGCVSIVLTSIVTAIIYLVIKR